jgi:hypothetical protein
LSLLRGYIPQYEGESPSRVPFLAMSSDVDLSTLRGQELNSYLVHVHVAIPTCELSLGPGGGNKECQKCFSAWWDADVTELSLVSCVSMRENR